MIRPHHDILQRDALLAVGPVGELGEFLSRRYPDCRVTRVASMLEAIDDLSRERVRAVIARVDEADPQLADAIAGLRDAAGERTKLLLCCPPEAEPEVRAAAADSAADDYLLWPLDGAELDAALGYVADDAESDAATPPMVALDELASLQEVLSALGEEPYALLHRLADMVRGAMGSAGVTLVVAGSAASSGETVANPVLSEPIVRDDQAVGQISVGPRAAAYRAGDVQKLAHYAGLIGQILATADEQRKWRREALTDSVSGLYNRRYVMRFLDDLLIRARTERFRVTVLLFDIDDFKAYNDTFGHGAGDEIIRQIGQLFRTHCREHDLVTRYGGDEFCVVFWDADQPRVAGSDHPTDALSVLGRFQSALKTYRCTSLAPDTQGQLTISGGLASFPWDAASAGELVEKADQALLKAKQAGKNRVFVFGDHEGDCADPPA